MRSSLQLSLLAVLAACGRNDSSSGPPPAALEVQGISVPDFGSWQANRPIEFAFSEPIDFASVSGRSIQIQTSADVPAAGTFEVKAIDADGDGVAEGTDETVVVFFPRCPQAEDLSDAGLLPGARYLVTLAGDDSDEDPGSLLRAVSGTRLAHSVVRAFETIADPFRTLNDERPNAAPLPLVRAPGANAGSACYLELGGDPAQRAYFEGDPDSGRLQGGSQSPLNLLGDPATRAAFVVVFDQLIRSTPENLARLSLEYNPILSLGGWTPLETRVELVSNCRPGDAAARLVALGTFPAGGFVRARVESGFEDLRGEATTGPLEEFAIAAVAAPAFASLEPAGAIADEIREEFDFGPESALSLADPSAPSDAAPAQWGAGELRANDELIRLPPELQEFDWVVQRFETLVFDTTATTVLGGPNGLPLTAQETTGGFVQVRDLVVHQGGAIRVRGPHPLVVHAAGSVIIRGLIEADGLAVPDLPAVGGGPSLGAPGSAGGGDGGSGTQGAQTRGGDGASALGGGVAGRGGESGLSTLGVLARRGGGGGGGRFARDQGPLSAESGGDGLLAGTGAESGLSPARGGAPGPDVFTDGDPSNDFFGIEPIVDASGAVVATRRGELDHVHAGAGGGNGGDSIGADEFPPPGSGLAVEGGGGGGGGGGIVIRARGPIGFGFSGRLRANGGRGGNRRETFHDPGGACGGSGSGGHVILESATAIDFTLDQLDLAQVWVEALGGPRVLQGTSALGFGGAGGPGVVQLHVPHPERGPGEPGANLILPPAALAEVDPLAAICQPRPHVLYPTLGPLSRARSRWIPLGAAGEPDGTVALRFEGVETAAGEDEGTVLASDGRVLELAPLLGPARLAQPGIELLPDGTSVALSGSVLAPLRASAQPISPDVYLRTPALLAGCTLRLASAADPGRRADLTVAGAVYDDAAARLTLAVGDLSGTLAEAVAELGGAAAVELALVPRFFRLRVGPGGLDLLPPGHSVRILFQGAADDGTGRADEANPLVDWTGDVSRFGALAPGALDFVRFQVEFGRDADAIGFDPDEDPMALEFLRLPLRF